MPFILEVQCEKWGGTLRKGWRPGITGTLNQTCASDELASLFASKDEAVEWGKKLAPDVFDWRVREVKEDLSDL